MGSTVGVEVFTTRSAAILTGVTLATIERWDGIGFFSPSVLEGDGRGSRRVFSFRDVVALRIAETISYSPNPIRTYDSFDSFSKFCSGIDRRCACMKIDLPSAISRYGIEAKAKLANPSASGEPEDQLRAPLEILFRRGSFPAGVGVV